MADEPRSAAGRTEAEAKFWDEFLGHLLDGTGAPVPAGGKRSKKGWTPKELAPAMEGQGCRVSDKTIYRWRRREQLPRRLEIKAAVDALFPVQGNGGDGRHPGHGALLALWDAANRSRKRVRIPATSRARELLPPSNTSSPGPAAGMTDLLGISQRVPPQSPQAEQALLGALLANNKAYEQVSEFLAPEHFADPIHGRIFRAVQRRVEAGQLADVFTLRPEFENSGELDEVGGPAYLALLLSAVVGIINAGEYGRLVHDCWLRRQLVDVGEEVVNRAFGAETELDAEEQLAAAKQRLIDLAGGGGDEGGFVTLDRALIDVVLSAERAFCSPSGVSGLPTGLRGLDAKTGGLHRSDLVILAGRPGMGKTALATKIAFGAARALIREAQEKGPKVQPRGTVAVFSLDMSADVLAARSVSEGARVSVDRIRRGDISQRDFDRFVEVSREMATMPIVIDDTPAITVSALRTNCQWLKRTRGLELVVVDYLQLMRPEDGVRPESRAQEISMITQGLKAIAKELSVPVIALSQLSRAVEQREDKRPQLSDLRESGSIEQDADVVMFVHRDEYYLAQRAPKDLAFGDSEKAPNAMEMWQSDMEQARYKAELIIAKQRHGPTGAVRLFFEAEFTCFGDLEQVHDGGYPDP